MPRGRPRKPVPEHLQPQLLELLNLTRAIKQNQESVLELSKQRTALVNSLRAEGVSTGSIAEACGLNRRSYPVRTKKG